MPAFPSPTFPSVTFLMPPFSFLGGGGGVWMLLSPSFYLLPFPQPRPSSSASLSGREVPYPIYAFGKRAPNETPCRWLQKGIAWHHRVCIRPLVEGFGDLPLCFAEPESWDCLTLSWTLGTFGTLQPWGACGRQGPEKGDGWTCLGH